MGKLTVPGVRARKASSDRSAPLVMVTAYDAPGARDGGLAHGVLLPVQCPWWAAGGAARLPPEAVLQRRLRPKRRARRPRNL